MNKSFSLDLDVEVKDGHATVYFPGVAGNHAVFVRDGKGGVEARSTPSQSTGVSEAEMRAAKHEAQKALYQKEEA